MVRKTPFSGRIWWFSLIFSLFLWKYVLIIAVWYSKCIFQCALVFTSMCISMCILKSIPNNYWARFSVSIIRYLNFATDNRFSVSKAGPTNFKQLSSSKPIPTTKKLQIHFLKENKANRTVTGTYREKWLLVQFQCDFDTFCEEKTGKIEIGLQNFRGPNKSLKNLEKPPAKPPGHFLCGWSWWHLITHRTATHALHMRAWPVVHAAKRRRKRARSACEVEGTKKHTAHMDKAWAYQTHIAQP